MSGEASQKQLSRAGAFRLAAIGAAGAAGVLLSDAPVADATTNDNSFVATNNGTTDVGFGFITQFGSGGHGYATGVMADGTNYGVDASSSTGVGVRATSAGTGSSGAGLSAANTGNGDAVSAVAGFIDGFNDGRAVYAEHLRDGDAVYGIADGLGAGVHGVGNGGNGVYAEDKSSATTANGLLATSSAGTAVNAATNTGIAVAAEAGSAGGTALWVSGPAAYSNCGVATVGGSVATPKQSVLVKGVKLSANSLVVATLQANIAGGFVASAVPHPTAGTITITLNQAVSQHVKIGWIAIDLIPISPV